MGNMSSQYESLTRDQKVLITRGWEIIRMDTLKFGTSVMYHLLAAHPKLDDFFHFENDEAKIRYHAKNFVREMDKWVRAIDSPQELDELLYTIATTHLPRKVGKDEYNKLRKSAMRQLKVQMGEEVFDKKMERVWDTCLSMVIAYLIDTMNVLKHEKRKKV